MLLESCQQPLRLLRAIGLAPSGHGLAPREALGHLGGNPLNPPLSVRLQLVNDVVVKPVLILDRIPADVWQLGLSGWLGRLQRLWRFLRRCWVSFRHTLFGSPALQVISRPGSQTLGLGGLEEPHCQPPDLLDQLGRRLLGGLPGQQRLLVALALQGVHEALRRLGPRLDEPSQGLLAPGFSLLGLLQYPPHPLVPLALEPRELTHPVEDGRGYRLLAGLAGSLAVFIASISAGLRASATASVSSGTFTIGGLNQSQNPLTSTAVTRPVSTVRA